MTDVSDAPDGVVVVEGVDDRLRLDDQLCFALYAATNAVTRLYRPMLRELGITYPQYLALMVLWQHGESTVGQLAAKLDLPGHALAPMIDRLQAAGLVERRRDVLDRRVVRVALTTAGADLEVAAAEVQRQVACTTGLSPAAMTALRGSLHDLVTDMREDSLDPLTGEDRAS